jgi:regulator of cell morphogenesis and NO signaling
MNNNMPTISETVRADYRAADVFRKWGINYCCGGNASLDEVCRLQGLDKAAIEADLATAKCSYAISNRLDFASWPLPFLVDFITNVHHAYIKAELPPLRTLFANFVKGHTGKYPELIQTEEIFNDLCEELLAHTRDEEEKLFPYMRQLAGTHERREIYGKLFVRTLRKPLADVISSEHRRISMLLQQLRRHTGNYSFPENACTNYQVIFRKLAAFDEDLVQHKHLENNILFPKAIAMEKELASL